RFVYALAQNGVLPRRLARLEPRTLVAGPALDLLLVLALAAAALLHGALAPAILAAAVAASLVHAAPARVRGGAPVVEPGRARWRRAAGRALAIALLLVGVGVVADAGAARGALLGLLGGAFVAGAYAAHRAARKVSHAA